MSNLWYLIAETVADAVEDRRERKMRGPRVRERPGSFSGERIGNTLVGLPTVHDDLTDRGVRHAIYNLVGRKFFDRLFLGTVMALALGLFVHISGLFPWVGYATFHHGPSLLPNHREDLGLHTLFLFEGQRLVIDYDLDMTDRTNRDGAAVAILTGKTMPGKFSYPVLVSEGSGRLSIPIERTGFLIVKIPTHQVNEFAVSQRVGSATVKWGAMWRDPGGDYRTRTITEVAADLSKPR